MGPYKYTALDGDSDKIRLLTLLPGPADAEIQCQLDVVRFTEAEIPQYEALSYTWGDLNKLLPLPILPTRDSIIEITQNLAELLPYLRHEQHPRVLWIDAICINQNDLKERSHQVKLMSKIYSKAERVIVWLGPATADSQTALTILENLSLKITVDWVGHGSMKSSSNDASKVHWGDQNCLLPFGISEWQAIAQLLKRPWFERLWIWQEVRLGNHKTIIMCGSTILLWKQFSDALYCIRYKRHVYPIPELSDLVDRAYEIVDFYEFIPLKTLLFQARHSKCIDKRDRIYAMLGMLHQREADLAIEPDYTKPWTEVYKEMVLRFVKVQSKLNIILTCELRNGVRGLPSWVPNFAIPKQVRPLINHRAAGESPCSIELLNDDTLRATGVMVGVLDSVSPLTPCKPSQYPYQHILELVRSFGQFRDMQATYRDGVTLCRAYARVLCNDRTSDRYLPVNETIPDLTIAEYTLKSILSSDTSYLPNISPATKLFLDYATDTCKGRSFFTTLTGHIGVGVEVAQPGDHLCVLLGCDSPVLLRPVPTSTHFLFVGEVFVPGLMCAEAILGHLPGRFKRVSRYDEPSSSYVGAYFDPESGEVRVEDPRLGELPPGWTRKKHALDHIETVFECDACPEWEGKFDPRLIRSVLVQQGVALQEFDIV